MQEPITYWAIVLSYCSFQIAGVDDSITDPPGFVKDEDDRLTGQLFDQPALTKILEKAPRPTILEMVKAAVEQLKDYASRGLTTVTDMAIVGIKSDDTEIVNGLLNILNHLTESEYCLAPLALYCVVHGPDDSNSNSKANAMCCPSLVRFDGYKVEINI